MNKYIKIGTRVLSVDTWLWCGKSRLSGSLFLPARKVGVFLLRVGTWKQQDVVFSVGTNRANHLALSMFGKCSQFGKEEKPPTSTSLSYATNPPLKAKVLLKKDQLEESV